MAFDAIKLRMALKDEDEHQTDDNYLVDVSDVFTRGMLRDMGIEHEMFGGYGEVAIVFSCQSSLMDASTRNGPVSPAFH